MERAILHCDLNNFFYSVESLDYPELQGKAVAVCGSVENRHGIVLAKSEEAKKYGIKTAQTVWQAKRQCPHLIICEPHYERYVYFSRLVRGIYGAYTDQVEPFGMDEAWLDVTGSRRLFGTGKEIGEKLRRQVREETGLTISVGVSFNKPFAKLGSDLKKPDGLTVIEKADFKEKIWPLSCSQMIGIGPATAKRLAGAGIFTLGELASASPDTLKRLLGKCGGQLWQMANGRDTSPVRREGEGEPVKSVGNSMTEGADLADDQAVFSMFLLLCESVSRRLREQGLLASAVAVDIRDDMLTTVGHQAKLMAPTRNALKLAQAAMQLFSQRWRWGKGRTVRSVGVRGYDLVRDGAVWQLSFFQETAREERLERLASDADRLRARYGRGALVRASLLGRNDCSPTPSALQREGILR